MVARYILLFALLVLSIRGFMFLYVHILANDIKDVDVRYEPVNHRVRPSNKRTSVGTARDRSVSSVSQNKSAQRPTSTKNSSYASYRKSMSK